MAKRPPNKRASAAARQQPADLDEVPFEKALAELEQIVDALEEGTLSLEDSIARFERGIRLSRHLEAQLRRAELRVRQLVGEEADEEGLGAFAGDDEEDEEASGDGAPQLPF